LVTGISLAFDWLKKRNMPHAYLRLFFYIYAWLRLFGLFD
jgi:hypothetical protein